MSTIPTPSSIIIVGSGVFGLSTALSLASREKFGNTTITVLESHSECPHPESASYDTSRILRADYSNPAYTALAHEAQALWRDQSSDGWGGEGRYHQPGFALVSSDDKGRTYVKKCLSNLRDLKDRSIQGVGELEVLETEEDVKRVTGGVIPGDWGYVNYGSGWAEADKVMLFAAQKLKRTRVCVKTGAEVTRLLFATEKSADARDAPASTVKGVELASGEQHYADLVVIAMGPWSIKLVDLRGRVEATGQPLMYIRLSQAEQEHLAKKPVVMNMSTGIYTIPSAGDTLKIGRNSYGYKNPTPVRYHHPGAPDQDALVSLPRLQLTVPTEATEYCQSALQRSFMWPGREFTKTRVSWYTDTQDGNFIIAYHPDYNNSLFLATGGSGHAWKFLPVIGDRIVDGIEGTLEPAFEGLWKWPPQSREKFAYELIPQGAGGRGGRLNMNLDEEMRREL